MDPNRVRPDSKRKIPNLTSYLTTPTAAPTAVIAAAVRENVADPEPFFRASILTESATKDRLKSPVAA